MLTSVDISATQEIDVAISEMKNYTKISSKNKTSQDKLLYQ